MTLAEIIRQYRAEHNLSYRQFAEKCGNITAQYISQIEKEKNPATKGKPILSVEKLNVIANGLNMTIDELIDKMDDMDVSVGTTPKEEPRKQQESSHSATVPYTTEDGEILQIPQAVIVGRGIKDLPEEFRNKFMIAALQLIEQYKAEHKED